MPLRLCLFTSLILGVLGCGGSAGEVRVSVTVADSSTDTSAVTHFIFIVQSTDSSGATQLQLFPQSCVRNNQCLEQTCGEFSKGQKNYRLELPFSDFPEEQSISLTVCAMNSNQATVLSGASTGIVNKGGQTAEVTMDLSSSCPSLPALCS